MFNDAQSTRPASSPTVDDIFAETDKSAPASGYRPAASAGAEIQTSRVGLTTESAAFFGEEKAQSSGRWFKISVIIIVLAILGLSSYLVYSKFFKLAPADDANLIATTTKPAVKSPAASSSKPAANIEAQVVPTSTPEISATSSIDISGVTIISSSSPVVATTTINETVSPLDSDADGLTDAEEALAGSNPLMLDSDSDGLSDYEEIKIYKTNPINPDSDGDTYKDGQEVKGGYNPNGPGKLSN